MRTVRFYIPHVHAWQSRYFGMSETLLSLMTEPMCDDILPAVVYIAPRWNLEHSGVQQRRYSKPIDSLPIHLTYPQRMYCSLLSLKPLPRHHNLHRFGCSAEGERLSSSLSSSLFIVTCMVSSKSMSSPFICIVWTVTFKGASSSQAPSSPSLLSRSHVHRRSSGRCPGKHITGTVIGIAIFTTWLEALYE